MRSLSYICASTGETIPLEGPDIWAQTAAGLRGREWSYTLGYRSLTGVSRTACKAELDLTYVRCPEKVDWTRRLFDADVAAGTPGMFDADGWTTRAYVVKAESQTITPVIIQQKLTVVLLDGIWRKVGESQHFWSDALTPGLDLDYPYDYPHDYLAATRNAVASNPMPTAMPFQMVIFGPVSNPQLTLGGNRYALDMDIPSGSYVTVTSIAGRRTIVMTAENGDETNVFDKGRRGAGLNGGEYIFQPIPAGDSSVQWSGFGVDLTVYQEESEPPWRN